MSAAQSIVIVGAARTPVGAFNGAFANVPAHELGAAAIGGALARAGVDLPHRVDQALTALRNSERAGSAPGSLGGRVYSDSMSLRRMRASASMSCATRAPSRRP